MVSDLYVSIYMKDRCVCAHLSADKRKIVCVYALKAYKFMCLCMFFTLFMLIKCLIMQPYVCMFLCTLE